MSGLVERLRGIAPADPEIRSAGKAPPPAGRDPASPRASTPPTRAGWRRISDQWARFEQSRAGDVAGGVIVAATAYAILFVAGAL